MSDWSTIDETGSPFNLPPSTHTLAVGDGYNYSDINLDHPVSYVNFYYGDFAPLNVQILDSNGAILKAGNYPINVDENFHVNWTPITLALDENKIKTIRLIAPSDLTAIADLTLGIRFTPITKYHTVPIYGTTSKGNNYIKGLTISLQATPEAPNTTVTDTVYRINGSGSWAEYTVPFSVMAGVTHKVEYYSKDSSGNQEQPNVMDFDKGKFTGAGSY